jgi:TnpA family transposase
LLENETVLRPREHMTDTHGYTEQLFGLCHLLGYAFMLRPGRPQGSLRRRG